MAANHLLEELACLPDELALVAIGSNKAPYLPRWQTTPLDKTRIRQELQGDRCKAVGVLCGVPSGGLLFLDHDGASCDRLMENLSGQPLADALPKTVGITSGRPGRYQLIYRIPEQYWEAIGTKRIGTGVEGEQLEFRWNGCQSVAIGHHPMTAGYRYLPGQSFKRVRDRRSSLVDGGANAGGKGTTRPWLEPVLSGVCAPHR